MKYLFAPITGILTLTLGIFVVGLFTLGEPLPELSPEINSEIESIPISVNPCILSARSEPFLNKIIVVQATLYQIDDHIIVYPNIYSEGFPARDCGVSDEARGYLSSTFDPSVWTDLDLKAYIGRNSELGLLFKNQRANWEIDVEIEGVLHEHPPSKYDATYGMTPTKIKLVSSWRKFTAKGAA